MQSPSIAEWNERFAIPGVAQVVAGNGGLPKISITTPAASADIYLHGAQVTSWQPAGSEDVLFVSEHSRWEEGRAIRGGVPICFPWFRGKADDSKAPAHGVVRTRAWKLDSLEQVDDQGGEQVVVTLSIASDEATRQWWPHEFHLVHHVTVGPTLKMELIVHNTGSTAIRFEEALHTYHKVADASAVNISGLSGLTYLDNMDDNREKIQEGEVHFTQPTDSAYLDTTQAFELKDPGLGRRIRTEKENSRTTVAWNPWAQGAAALADLGNDEWRKMACVEASNILDAAVDLAPGEQHTLVATLSVFSESD